MIQDDQSYEVVKPPVGATVPYLPEEAAEATVGGKKYFVHNGTYFEQLLYDSLVDVGGSPSVMVAGRGNLTIDGSGIGGATKTQQWAISGHAAAAGEPFRHWDADYELDGYTPAGIQSRGDPDCSKCHSTPGSTQNMAGDVLTAARCGTGSPSAACSTTKPLMRT